MEFGRIWRIAKTPVILLSLLLLVGLSGWWGYNAMTAPMPPPYVAPCVERPLPDGVLKSDMVQVRVHNASTKRGKAAEVSQQLKRQGFTVRGVGNADENQEKSVIKGYAKDAPEVELVLAQFNGFEVEADGRRDRSVEIIIGQNYDSMIGEAPRELSTGAQTICLPATPTPAAA
ncbi:LytR C-terminal domain-containing protein [Ammonicoccus fulvus]|uniref:LytR C-terminal domain-containing protein n=1 Tax=Ammonicoccus fulvus TaxID=3138240 RepID=A0ABZ3FKH0_9ACTN